MMKKKKREGNKTKKTVKKTQSFSIDCIRQAFRAHSINCHVYGILAVNNAWMDGLTTYFAGQITMKKAARMHICHAA